MLLRRDSTDYCRDVGELFGHAVLIGGLFMKSTRRQIDVYR